MINDPTVVEIKISQRRQCERTNDKEVVVIIAFETELSLIRVYSELIVTGAALGYHWRTGAWRQPAPCGGNEIREDILGKQIAIGLIAL